MSEALVSIIVPIYNAEKYLAECIESILSQTYKNIEIILINDGSKDNSLSIAEKYSKENKNIIIYSTENRGVCAARNTGLSLAGGEYIMFVDSDDSLMINAVEKLLDALQTENADIAVGSHLQCDTSEREIWTGKTGLEKAIEDNEHTYSVWAKLFKKSSTIKHKFCEGKKIHEDAFFYFQCLTYNPKIVITNEKVYNYRYNPTGASHSCFSEKFYDILYFAKRKLEIINEIAPELNEKAKNIWVKANLAMLHQFLNTDDKKYKADEKACIKAVKDYKKYFVPAIKGDQKFFNVVVNNLYYIFKIYYKLRYKK